MGKIDEISKMDRPVLGESVPLLIFRAFRHFTADYVKQMLGRGAAVVFTNSGRDLGREIGESLKKDSLDEYLGAVAEFSKGAGVGLLKVTENSAEKMVVGVDECITCAGMDNIGERICHFEVGFVAGIVEAFVGTRVRAHESKCNANGEELCEVTVELKATE